MSIEKGNQARGPANENAPYDLNHALTDINILKQQMLAGGRVDSEMDALTQIVIDVRNGRLSPAEGIMKARMLAESRQEDH